MKGVRVEGRLHARMVAAAKGARNLSKRLRQIWSTAGEDTTPNNQGLVGRTI